MNNMNLVAKLRFFMETPTQREESTPTEQIKKGIQKNSQINSNKENFVSHSIRRSLY